MVYSHVGQYLHVAAQKAHSFPGTAEGMRGRAWEQGLRSLEGADKVNLLSNYGMDLQYKLLSKSEIVHTSQGLHLLM